MRTLHAAAVILLLILWATRLQALQLLPLHNDEGLHLTRAVQVWNFNPFWEISDGKIVNHWLIALFYPQNAPDFVGRAATVMTAMIGMAAAFALVRGLTRDWRAALLLVGALWIASPYLFFYERLAFSDAQAGAFGLAALAAAWRLRRHPRWQYALLTGAALALAMLFKVSAAPFGLSIALLVLTSPTAIARRLRHLIIIGLVVAAAFAVPVGYLLATGRGPFDIALGWLGGGGSGGLTLVDNAGRLFSLLFLPDAPLWGLLLIAGLLAAALLGSARIRLMLAAALIPLLLIVLLGRDAQSRHFIVAVPPLIALAGIGLARLTERIPAHARRLAPAAVGLLALAAFVPFALRAYREPQTLQLPPLMAWQYITGFASGYGLREAVAALPQQVTRPELDIVGSMYPDSCRRANFYAVNSLTMWCGDAPGLAVVENALAEDGAVYLMTEQAGSIGLAPNTLDASAQLLGAYPRPGQTAEEADVQLWLLQNR